jgi:lipoprotein signal peptidase
VITGRQVGIAAGIAATTIAADQGLKAYVRSHAHEQQLRTHDGRVGTLPVVWDPKSTDEFALVYVDNANDPLALGGGSKGSKVPAALALGIIPVVAGATLYAGATKFGHGAKVAAAAAIVGAGLASGGALSNGVEKLVRNKVTDMLFVSRQGIAWNGADLALGTGALLSVGVLGARLVHSLHR